MKYWAIIGLSLTVSMSAGSMGCSGGSDAPPTAVAPVPATTPPALRPGEFRLSEVRADPDGGKRYIADASVGQSVCSFEIAIQSSKASADRPFSLASASLVRRPNADCAAFLQTLAPALGFTGDLPDPPRVERLVGSVAILGTNQSRSPDEGQIAGSFSSTPSGSWIATKLFLADGEGEVFLNLNAHDRVGEFSVKDEDYAAIVVSELSKVLLPSAVQPGAAADGASPHR